MLFSLEMIYAFYTKTVLVPFMFSLQVLYLYYVLFNLLTHILILIKIML